MERTPNRILDDVKKVEETIQWLKDVDRWYLEYPLHQGEHHDGDGKWPKDNISIMLDEDLMEMDRQKWKELVREIGLEAEFDSDSSSNNDIVMRPFGVKSNWNSMQVKIFRDKIVCVGTVKEWTTHLNNTSTTSDTPQQRILKVVIAYSGSRAKAEGMTEWKDKKERSFSRSQKRSLSHSREKEKGKRLRSEEAEEKAEKKKEKDEVDIFSVAPLLSDEEEDEEKPLKVEVKIEQKEAAQGSLMRTMKVLGISRERKGTSIRGKSVYAKAEANSNR